MCDDSILLLPFETIINAYVQSFPRPFARPSDGSVFCPQLYVSLNILMHVVPRFAPHKWGATLDVPMALDIIDKVQ
jgi:hypothetical protein